MKGIVAVALAVVTTVQSTVAAAHSTGPVQEAMARTAQRLALTLNQGADTNWANLRALKPGTKVVVVTRGSAPQTGSFVSADSTHLVLFKGRGVGTLASIERAHIVQISEVITASSVVWPLVGAATGALLGVGSAIGVALDDRPCGQYPDYSCTGRAVGMWSLAVGFPVAGGLIGHYASRHITHRIVYRAP